MPFTDPSSLGDSAMSGTEGNYPLANGIWWKVRTELKPGDAVWVTFEHGNMDHPIIVGQFGTTVPLASEFNGTIGGGESGGASYGDSTVIDKSGQLEEHGTISNLKYLVLHTSGCTSIDQLINVLKGEGLGVQAAVDDQAIYKLATDYKAFMYHCKGINDIAIGCEQIESPHIKWNSNMTAIPDQDYFKNHLQEILAYHDKVYNNAVNLFGYWCITYGLDTSAIISHLESAKHGGTSDHGDPEELWNYFYKYTNDKKWTMDGFRAAVKERIPTLKISEGGGVAGNYSKYIFVGDSRTAGMYSTMSGDETEYKVGTDNRNPSDYYICKTSMGYSWFTQQASTISSAITSNSAVIILMGCNDLGTPGIAKRYADYVNGKYSEWHSKGADVFFVSVNPIDDSRAARVGYTERDSQAVSFNNELRSQLSNGVRYIDTYSAIKGNFSASDGIHYDDATYRKIYTTIKGG